MCNYLYYFLFFLLRELKLDLNNHELMAFKILVTLKELLGYISGEKCPKKFDGKIYMESN